MSTIRQACAERISGEREALARCSAGGSKVVAYACHAFPAAVIAGLGLWPVRIVCGTSAGAESAGEKIVRADVCPLVKTLLGNVAEGRGLHARADLWIGLFTCDQMRRGLDCLSGRLGREVHPLQLPATRTPEAAAYYSAQVRRLVADLEARHGLRFQEGLARRWEHHYNEAGGFLSRAARSGTVAPLDLHAMFHLLMSGRPFGLASFFRELIAGSEEFRPSARVVLTGSPLTMEDTALLEVLESRRVGVVPLNCTGLNAVEHGHRVPEGADLPESLALSAFHRPPCIRARPNTEVFERIRQTISTMETQGLIVKCLKFCDLWYTERERMRRSFDKPVLVFDSDYAAGGRERMATRIEAFLEVLT